MVFPYRRRSADPHRSYRERLIRHLGYELVPMKGVEAAVAALPTASTVPVTCSPIKGIGATLDLCADLAAAGHAPVPHLAARMVESHDHLCRIVERLETAEITEVFVIAGDSPAASGPFSDSMQLLESLLGAAPWLTSVGFAGYPDGHPLISLESVHAAIHRKHAMVAEAGVDGYVVTQMCLSPDLIRDWIGTERANGMDLPIHLGIPGVLDRAKLLSMGMRLGVGSSLRYLKKNRSTLRRLLTSRGYTPDQLLVPLNGDLEDLGITALHAFTFNQVATTAEWQATATKPVA